MPLKEKQNNLQRKELKKLYALQSEKKKQIKNKQNYRLCLCKKETYCH